MFSWSPNHSKSCAGSFIFVVLTEPSQIGEKIPQQILDW